MQAAKSTRICLAFFALAVTVPSALFIGCAGPTDPTGPNLNGNTTVTLLTSSTANDQLAQFDLSFNYLTLTNQAGKTVTLLATPINSEFIHVNGVAEPLVTATIPQGIYTAATASIGYSQFTCQNLNSTGGLQTSTFAFNPTPASGTTISLPSPITITGTAMELSLDLLVSKSASWATCDPAGIASYSITPTFTLTPLTIAAQPTNPMNGKLTGLKGLITAVGTANANLTVASAQGPVWDVDDNSATTIRGVPNLAALTVGMPVNFDASFQSDGSLLATRIDVPNTNIGNLSLLNGPLDFVDTLEPGLDIFGREEQGYLFATTGILGPVPFDFGSDTFQISNQLINLPSLPFTPSFTATNMVAGQNVTLTSSATTIRGGTSPTPSSTLTLIPQTLNGTVSVISNSGSFIVYTIQLAPYDLPVNLAVQQGQTTLLQNPSTVLVYADASTQQLNALPITAGSVFRFHGLLFNDNGTLRMDCTQINDGVPE